MLHEITFPASAGCAWRAHTAAQCHFRVPLRSAHLAASAYYTHHPLTMDERSFGRESATRQISRKDLRRQSGAGLS